MNEISVSVLARNEPVNEIEGKYYFMKEWLQKEDCSNTSKRKEILELYQQ